MSRPRLASSHETFTVPGVINSSAARKTAGRGVAKCEKQGWLNIKSWFKINSISFRVMLFHRTQRTVIFMCAHANMCAKGLLYTGRGTT